MKTISKLGAQGDVMFRRVKSIPKTATVAQPVDGRHVVAHSETGHHHALDAVEGVTMHVIGDPLVCYLRLDADADVIHYRGWDTHETLRLTPGIYEVRRQREYTPEGWRRVED